MCKLDMLTTQFVKTIVGEGIKNILPVFYMLCSVSEVTLHICISWFVLQVLLLVYPDNSRELDRYLGNLTCR